MNLCCGSYSVAVRNDLCGARAARLIAELDAPEARTYRAAVLDAYDALVKAVAARDAEVAKRVKDDPALAQVFDAARDRAQARGRVAEARSDGRPRPVEFAW